MPVKNPFKTDALQLGSNATSPFISKTIDNNLLFFDQAVGEVTLKDLIPASPASTQNILNSIQDIQSSLSSKFQDIQSSLSSLSPLSLPKDWSPSNKTFLYASESSKPSSQDDPNHPAILISDPSHGTVLENFSFESPFSSPSAPLIKVSSSNDQPPRSITFRNCSFSLKDKGCFLQAFKTNVFFENCSFESLSNSSDTKILIQHFKSASFQPSISSKTIPNLFFEHNPSFFSGGSLSLHAPSHSIPYLSLDNCSASLFAKSFKSISSFKSSIFLHSLTSTPSNSLNLDKASLFTPNKLLGSIIVPEGLSDFTVHLPAPLHPDSASNYSVLLELSQSLAEAQAKPSFSSNSQNQLTLTLGSNSSSFIYDKNPSSFSISLPPFAQNHEISINWLLLT